MSPRPDPVVADLTLRRTLRGSANRDIVLEMQGTLSYKPSDPFAVTLTIFAAEWPVYWTISRDLLLRGCQTCVGMGDVRIEPYVDAQGRSLLWLELTSDDGAAVLTTPAADVIAFCERALEAIPLGAEADHLDLDGVIDRLLRDA